MWGGQERVGVGFRNKGGCGGVHGECIWVPCWLALLSKQQQGAGVLFGWVVRVCPHAHPPVSLAHPTPQRAACRRRRQRVWLVYLTLSNPLLPTRTPPYYPTAFIQTPSAEGDVLEQAQARLQAVRRRIDRQLDAVRPPVAPQQRLVLGDGVHLFDPLAPHHEVLAREGTASMSKGERALGTLGPRVLMEGWRGVSVRERGRHPCPRVSTPWVQGWSWRLLEGSCAGEGVACSCRAALPGPLSPRFRWALLEAH